MEDTKEDKNDLEEGQLGGGIRDRERAETTSRLKDFKRFYQFKEGTFSSWFDSHYMPAARRHHWTEEQAIKEVYSYIKGDVIVILKPYQKELAATKTIEELKGVVNRYLKGSMHQAKVAKTLMSINQKEGESVTAYFTRFSNLATEIPSDKLGQNTMVSAWVPGLSSGVGTVLQGKTFDTMSAAYQAALDAEPFVKEEEKTVVNAVSEPTTTSKTKTSSNRCGKCKGQGHLTSNCWKCYFCHEFGHKKQDCKKAKEAQRGSDGHRGDHPRFLSHNISRQFNHDLRLLMVLKHLRR